MAVQIRVTTTDGVTIRGVEYTSATTDQETAPTGVAEATVLAAAEGTTAVASPTTTPNPGPSRGGIDIRPLGRMERCAVCGFIRHRREMIRQRGGWVERSCYDELVPLRGRNAGIVPVRRSSTYGAL